MAEGGKTIEPDMASTNEDVVIQQLLEQMKSDRMQELQRLKTGDRPVTGTDSRNNINSFFAKRLDAQAATEGKENVPVNVDRVEEHRPDTVVVEIQGLVEQQRVSNTLSTNFRRHLENIIRGSISSVTRNHSQRPSPQSSTRTSASPQSSNTPSPVLTPRQSNSSERQSPVPTPRPRNLAILQHLTERSRSNSVASSNSSLSNTDEVPIRAPDLPFVERLVAPDYQPGSQAISLEEVDNLYRENIVQEISELVHRQLVTTTLDSTFRNVLEISMQDRLGQTGTDGQRVQEFVRNIHPTQPIQRNDFSNIGLPPQNDNWDNISITSVSAHAVPYTQSNLHLSREIHSLKSQLQEMKDMLKLSFDLQLDIQRAIRQEVAAALAQGKGGAEGGISVNTKSKPVNDTHCLICIDNRSDSVLYQCGHMCVCYACGQHLISRGAKCPVCRAPIKDIIRAYKSNESEESTE